MIVVDVNSNKFNYPTPWDNLVADIEGSWLQTPRSNKFQSYVDVYLAGLGARNIMYTDYIEFSDSSDALAFVLKYGGYKMVDKLPDQELELE